MRNTHCDSIDHSSPYSPASTLRAKKRRHGQPAGGMRSFSRGSSAGSTMDWYRSTSSPFHSVLADGAAHRIRLFALADVPLQYVELACRRLGQRFLAALDGADVGHAQPQPPQQHDLPQRLHIVLGVIAVAVLAACRREQPFLLVKPDVRPGQSRPALCFRYVHTITFPSIDYIIRDKVGLQSSVFGKNVKKKEWRNSTLFKAIPHN